MIHDVVHEQQHTSRSFQHKKSICNWANGTLKVFKIFFNRLNRKTAPHKADSLT